MRVLPWNRHSWGVCHNLHSPAIAGYGQQSPAGTAAVLDVVAHLRGVWDEGQADADEAAQQGRNTAGLKKKQVSVKLLFTFAS
jgi:hypothetical protein